MPFLMKGASIFASVLIDGTEYDLSCNKGFANSLRSLTMNMKLGHAWTVSIELSPPFQQAKDIIESGLIGIGFSKVEGSEEPATITSISGVMTPVPIEKPAKPEMQNVQGGAKSSSVKKAEVEDKAEAKPIPKDMPVSMKAKWWYENKDEDKAESPLFVGMMTIPNFEFGEEISITMGATTGAAQVAAGLERPKSYEGKTYQEVIEEIADELNIGVVWTGTTESVASEKTYNGNIDVCLYLFVIELCEKMGCYMYIGPDPEDEESLENFVIVSGKDMKEGKPVCELVMYKQINPNGAYPIYPVTNISTSISHTAVLGLKRSGANVTTTSPEDKESKVNRADTAGYNKDEKAVGSTQSGLPVIGKKTKDGDVSGLSSTKDEDSSFSVKGANVNEDNPDVKKEMQHYANFSLDKAFEMTLTCPGIPWLVPGVLVKTDIGGIRQLTGTYILREVTHKIDEGGAETTLVLQANIGPLNTEDVGGSQNTSEPEKVESKQKEINATMSGGLIETVKSAL